MRSLQVCRSVGAQKCRYVSKFVVVCIGMYWYVKVCKGL